MRIEWTGIDGLCLLFWKVADDERGSFARTFCRSELAEAGLPFNVVQASLSRNRARHTLRGMHIQNPPFAESKIVSCARGRIWDAAVDLRPGSATFRQWRAFELAPDSDCAVHVPRGVAHGFLTLEDDCEVHYLMDEEYAPAAAGGIRWDDPAIGIDWPAQPAAISQRDAGFRLIGDGG